MVERQPSKLHTRVRFPSSAPSASAKATAGLCGVHRRLFKFSVSPVVPVIHRAAHSQPLPLMSSGISFRGIRGCAMRFIQSGCLGFIILLAGCATAPPSPLTVASAKTLKLDAINVTVAPDAQIAWANVEHEYASKRSAEGSMPKRKITETGSIGLNSDPNAGDTAALAELMKTPEAKAYVQDRISRGLKASLEKTLLPELKNGNRPTRLDVTVTQFSIPSAVQRVIIGGAPAIVASATLKDAATGEVLAERKDMAAIGFAMNGWAGVLADQLGDDLDVRVVGSYSSQFKDWLVPKS
jgi:hypothetical protein